MTDKELRAWVKNNPQLKRMVEAGFNDLAGEMKVTPIEKMSAGELRDKVKFDRDHIRGRSTVGYDKATKKILDGIGVEWPKNYQILPRGLNYPTKQNIETWVRDNPNETVKIKNIK